VKKKIKIYLFNPYPSLGGVDTTLKRFFLSLDLNYEIEYLSLKKTEKFNKQNIKNTVINSSSTFKAFFKIYNIVKKDTHENKYFFSTQYFVNVWSVIFIKLILKEKLFIYEVLPVSYFNYYNSYKELIKNKILKIFVKFLYKYADIIASCSKELSKDLSKYVNKEVITIYNPCYKKSIKIKRAYKKKQKIRILNIARFESQKDHFTLLKAINHTNLKDQINLTLVGYGKNLKSIKEFIKVNKINAKILTKENKLDKFYKNNDLYVCTSVFEGLPTTVVEAASYGMPIISSDFKTGSNEIFKNGNAGSIFKVGDHKELSKLIMQFYKDPKIFFSKATNCRENLYRFSIKKNTDLFKKTIKRLD
jgi:glycosyltransferase involved in cell wall biosynthesis